MLNGKSRETHTLVPFNELRAEVDRRLGAAAANQLTVGRLLRMRKMSHILGRAVHHVDGHGNSFLYSLEDVLDDLGARERFFSGPLPEYFEDRGSRWLWVPLLKLKNIEQMPAEFRRSHPQLYSFGAHSVFDWARRRDRQQMKRPASSREGVPFMAKRDLESKTFKPFYITTVRRTSGTGQKRDYVLVNQLDQIERVLRLPLDEKLWMRREEAKASAPYQFLDRYVWDELACLGGRPIKTSFYVEFVNCRLITKTAYWRADIHKLCLEAPGLTRHDLYKMGLTRCDVSNAIERHKSFERLSGLSRTLTPAEQRQLALLKTRARLVATPTGFGPGHVGRRLNMYTFDRSDAENVKRQKDELAPFLPGAPEIVHTDAAGKWLQTDAALRLLNTKNLSPQKPPLNVFDLIRLEETGDLHRKWIAPPWAQGINRVRGWVWNRRELISIFGGESDDEAAPEQAAATKRRRGRPGLDQRERRFRLHVLGRWERAKPAGVAMKDFLKEEFHFGTKTARVSIEDLRRWQIWMANTKSAKKFA